MKNLCIECDSRPATSSHFLCFHCKREEDRRDVQAIDEKLSREFKLELRELAQDLPAFRVRQ